jgi:hypothetical protein
MSGGGLHDAAG